MTDSEKMYDVTVIGAGIAGASVASELAAHASVLLLERESQPGYHSTGRSAAMYIPSYGPPVIQQLTKASGDFFNNPPGGFCQSPLLHPRAELLVARSDQLGAIDTFMSQHADTDYIQRLTATEVIDYCPLFKRNYAAGGVLDTSGSEIDVNALHQGYLSTFGKNKGTLLTDAEVTGLHDKSGCWHIASSRGNFRSRTVVNAAGAWAEVIGQLAGAELIGLVPKRRTAMIIQMPGVSSLNSMPLVADIDEAFYIKPEAHNLLISPANADPIAACDVQPEELDIAVCIDRIENAFDFRVTKILRKWAGLRSFVKDSSPVAGYSRKAERFFWLAGQGGYGIQSSPALSTYAAATVLGQPLPMTLEPYEIGEDCLGVERLQG